MVLYICSKMAWNRLASDGYCGYTGHYEKRIKYCPKTI